MRLPGTNIGARRVAPFSQPIAKPKKVSPEETWWFWYPDRVGIKKAPEWFDKDLKAIDNTLEVTWSPVHERWLVWARSNSINKLSPGWRLLFPVQYPDKSYMPLDERIFARLYSADGMQWGSAKHYFEHFMAEFERDKAKREKDREDNVRYAAGEYYGHIVPSVSGYGPSNGSKFSNL